MNINQATQLTKILRETKKSKNQELIETITDNEQFLQLFEASDIDHLAFEKLLSDHFESIEVPSDLKANILSSIKEIKSKNNK